MPDQSPIDTVRPVVERARARLSSLLPRSEPTEADRTTAILYPERGGIAAGPFAAETRDLATIFAAFDAADTIVQSGGTNVIALLGDRNLRPEVLKANATALLDTIVADAEAELTKAQRLSEQVIVSVRDKALVHRPQPADAAQEARLGNVRADLRMLLDPLDGEQLIDRMLDLVRRYMADDPNGLEAWLLTATAWPADYLESRGRPPVLFTARIPDAIGVHGSEGQREARLILAELEGPEGLDDALNVMQHIIRYRAEEIRAAIARTA